MKKLIWKCSDCGAEVNSSLLPPAGSGREIEFMFPGENARVYFWFKSNSDNHPFLCPSCIVLLLQSWIDKMLGEG